MVDAGPPIRMSCDRLGEPTRSLLAGTVGVATGNEAAVEARSADCVAAGVPGRWVDELLLQSTLIVGWPRALVAFAIWRRLGAATNAGEPAGGDSSAEDWQLRGEQICREVYGKNYEKLRANVRAL